MGITPQNEGGFSGAWNGEEQRGILLSTPVPKKCLGGDSCLSLIVLVYALGPVAGPEGTCSTNQSRQCLDLERRPASPQWSPSPLRDALRTLSRSTVRLSPHRLPSRDAGRIAPCVYAKPDSTMCDERGGVGGYACFGVRLGPGESRCAYCRGGTSGTTSGSGRTRRWRWPTGRPGRAHAMVLRRWPCTTTTTWLLAHPILDHGQNGKGFPNSYLS